jgi:hypothetical protein
MKIPQQTERQSLKASSHASRTRFMNRAREIPQPVVQMIDYHGTAGEHAGSRHEEHETRCSKIELQHELNEPGIIVGGIVRPKSPAVKTWPVVGERLPPEDNRVQIAGSRMALD